MRLFQASLSSPFKVFGSQLVRPSSNAAKCQYLSRTFSNTFGVRVCQHPDSIHGINIPPPNPFRYEYGPSQEQIAVLYGSHRVRTRDGYCLRETNVLLSVRGLLLGAFWESADGDWRTYNPYGYGATSSEEPRDQDYFRISHPELARMQRFLPSVCSTLDYFRQGEGKEVLMGFCESFMHSSITSDCERPGTSSMNSGREVANQIERYLGIIAPLDKIDEDRLKLLLDDIFGLKGEILDLVALKQCVRSAACFLHPDRRPEDPRATLKMQALCTARDRVRKREEDKSSGSPWDAYLARHGWKFPDWL